MKKHTLTIAILFIWCSSVFPQEPVKFSTKQTRELWQICSESFRNLNPSMGPNIYYPVCDCYVDHIRNNYTSEQIMIDNSSFTRVFPTWYAIIGVINPVCLRLFKSIHAYLNYLLMTQIVINLLYLL